MPMGISKKTDRRASWNLCPRGKIGTSSLRIMRSLYGWAWLSAGLALSLAARDTVTGEAAAGWTKLGPYIFAALGVAFAGLGALLESHEPRPPVGDD